MSKIKVLAHDAEVFRQKPQPFDVILPLQSLKEIRG